VRKRRTKKTAAGKNRTAPCARAEGYGRRKKRSGDGEDCSIRLKKDECPRADSQSRGSEDQEKFTGERALNHSPCRSSPRRPWGLVRAKKEKIARDPQRRWFHGTLKRGG